MKHVKEFNKINESEDDYIDIMNTDKKSQILDILNEYSTDASGKNHGIDKSSFDEIAEEISNLFK